MEFKVSGGGRSGADGFAFWYSLDPKVEGPVYGSKDEWTGLGIFFDTFDNDNNRDNPQIYAALNDGSWKFNPDKDGNDEHKLGSCKRLFRNSLKTSRVKIRYQNGLLTVATDIQKNDSWEDCFSASISLPVGQYYFGVSAETGWFFDNHDIYSIQTSDLNPLSYQEIIAQMKEKREKGKLEAVEEQDLKDEADLAQKQQQIQEESERKRRMGMADSNGVNNDDNNSGNSNSNDNSGNEIGDGRNSVMKLMDKVMDSLNDRVRAVETLSKENQAKVIELGEQVSRMLHSHETVLEQLKKDFEAARKSAGENRNIDGQNQDGSTGGALNPLTEEMRLWLEEVDNGVKLNRDSIQVIQQSMIAKDDVSGLTASIEDIRQELRLARDGVSAEVENGRKTIDRETKTAKNDIAALRLDVNNVKRTLNEVEKQLNESNNSGVSALQIFNLVLAALALAISAYAAFGNKQKNAGLPF